MLSRLKRRTPSTSSRAPVTDDEHDHHDHSRSSSHPPSPTPSNGNNSIRFADNTSPTKSRKSASHAEEHASGRTLSPERARTRSSRASSSASINSNGRSPHSSAPVQSALANYPNVGLVNGLGLGVGGGAGGQGNLSLEHLNVEAGGPTQVVRAPDLVIDAASPDYPANARFANLSGQSDSELPTPLASHADRQFNLDSTPTISSHMPRSASQTHRATPSVVVSSLSASGRPRSATMYETTTPIVTQPNGLQALAAHNVPAPGSQANSAESSTLNVDHLNGTAPNSNSPSRPASRPASRSASRPGSRSSSVNSQQYPDSLGVRPTSLFAGKVPKRQKSSSGGMSGIAGALALSGVALASPSPQLRQPIPLSRKSGEHGQGRESTDSHRPSEDDAHSNYGGGDGLLSMDALGDFDDVVSQLGTGYAVASSKRNADFHSVFKNIPEDDYLIEDYGCALQREILIQGRIYISEHHLSFNANIFGWVTSHTLPFAEIVSIEKRMTAYVIPNAIQVTTLHARYTFASFLSRDSTYDLICNIWRMVHPAIPPSIGDDDGDDLSDEEDHASVNDHDESGEGIAKRARSRLRGLRRRANTGASITVDEKGHLHPGANHASRPAGLPATPSPQARQVHPVTTDTLATLKNLKEVCMDTVFPSAPEKIYNLMFTSGFMKSFWTENQKLMELQISDWAPEKSGSNLLSRSMSYIKPLNGSIGPKQTKCLITDESAHVDFDNFVTIITTTRTPDVPSGNAFAVKTRTSMTWAKGNQCRVVVTTGVEWSKSSFIKGIIERSCIDGQKTYHADLEAAMRAYISQHRSEFLEEGQDVEQEQIKDAEDEAERDKEAQEKGQNGTVPTATGATPASGEAKPFLKTVLDSLEGVLDMFSGVSPTSAGLAFVIAILVISNLWTLSSRPADHTATTMRGAKSSHAAARNARHPDAVAEAVRDVLQDYFAVRPPGAPRPGHGAIEEALEGQAGEESEKRAVAVDPKVEAEAIAAALDGLEARLLRLRGALAELD